MKVQRMQQWIGSSAATAVLALGVAVAPGSGRAAPADGGPVLLLAAASTIDAVTELAELFRKQTGILVRVSAGASNALAQQILAGAPADVLLSANEKWAETVVRADLSLQIRALLTNELVIVVPKGNPAGVHDPKGLLSSRVKHVAVAAETAPAGMYAEQCLRRTGVYEPLLRARRIVRGEDVRFALGFVEAGEAQAGVLYATDARASNRVEVVYRFQAESHEPVLYPLVLLKHARHTPAARRFYHFLSSDAAMKVFRTHGFSPHPGPADK